MGFLSKLVTSIGGSLFGPSSGPNASGLATQIGNLTSGIKSLFGGIGGVGNPGIGGGPGGATPGGGILGAAGGIINKANEGIAQVKETISMKNDIQRMTNPKKYWAKQGEAQRAYQESLYPGTSVWSRIGSGGGGEGIMGAAMSAGASTQSARTSSRPAERQQNREDKLFQKNFAKLDAETQKIIRETANIAEKTKSEIERAKWASMRELVQAMPYNWQQLATVLGQKWFFEAVDEISKQTDIKSIKDLTDKLRSKLKSSSGAKIGKAGFNILRKSSSKEER